MSQFLDNVYVATATTGTGTITLGAAQSGGQTETSAGAVDGATYSYRIDDGSAWEEGTGTYTASGRSLSRTLVSSSTGSFLNLSGSALVQIVAQSADITNTTVIDAMLFGDGFDGTVTVSGSQTLSRDMFYANLTCNSSCAITTSGYRMLVQLVLNLTNAPAGSIKWNGANGGNASSATAGTTGGGLTGKTCGGGGAGAGGISTVSGTGNVGNNNAFYDLGGGTAASGRGAVAGTNGITAVGGGKSLAFLIGAIIPTNPPGGGCGAPSGSNGNTTNNATGAGGSGGGVIYIAARSIARDSSTSAAAAIQTKGGNAGTTFAGSGGGTTGAGGSAGGGGGAVIIIFRFLTGTQKTTLIDVTGGTGGAGTAASGTGGDGGGSGAGGRVSLYDVDTGVLTETAPVSALSGNAHSGASGGGTRAATTSQVAL